MDLDMNVTSEARAPDSCQVGDEVQYLPHVCHAFNCDQNNEYPWVIGLRANPRYETNPATGEKELVEDVIEVDEGTLNRTVLPGIHRMPDQSQERKRLVPLRPKKPWKALVTKVNEDGTMDLDVTSNVGNGMLTLHYCRVPVDGSGKVPHSCCKTRAAGGSPAQPQRSEAKLKE